MDSNPWLWLGLNLLSILVLSFYSMMEMACVSFNKVRLQYYVSQGSTRAIRLNDLLQHPSYLFGTTLIGVNVALIFGSEFARQFHSAIGLSPDLAPLTQVMLVVIFGELAPMFAARRYAENMAMLGINLLYLSSKLMTPILWCITLITRFSHWLIGSRSESTPNIFLTQEELQKILEEHDEEKAFSGASEDFNAIVSNIFSLRSKTVIKVMTSLKSIPLIPSTCTIRELREMLKKIPHDFFLIYQRNIHDVVGIAFPRDLLRESENKRVRDYTRQPWFITEHTEIVHILKQFRQNNQTVAVVVDDKGLAVGILTLEDIIEEIFGKTSLTSPLDKRVQNVPLIERTFAGDMQISEFNRMYDVKLDPQGAETFSELILKILGHLPEEGESIYLPPFELQVKEVSLMEIKEISIKTKVT